MSTLECTIHRVSDIDEHIPWPAKASNATRLNAARASAEMSDWITAIAPCSLPVLITGESGVGKERTARAVHDASRRAAGPFVAINCAALTESLLESELFGATRGAYTGADRDRKGLFREAHGGTLFLDEVGDMPAGMQAKLLRTLDGGRVRAVGSSREINVDVRIVAATHRDLEHRIESGQFRADLYYRLAVLLVRVPALRDRLDDLPQLVESMIARIGHEIGGRRPRLTKGAMEQLHAYRWPGNIRQLHSVLARASIRAAGRPIEPQHLELPIDRRPAQAESRPLEQAMVERALLESRGSIAGAALRIGWTRQKLYRRIAALGLEPQLPPRKGPEVQERGGTRSSESSTFQ
jgi:DNA-binding NtrC family response regulator